MADDEKPKARLEIGHVLFIDLVGYSKLLVHQQSDLLRELNEVVTATREFREAEAEGKLIRLPTGDGMALVFRTDPEAPAQCAVEIARALKGHPCIALRMGIHSGPINEVIDVNQQRNMAGAGINIAQRVMDCGDAGHILVSKHVADDLEQHDRWRPLLHGLGSCEVKHGLRLDISNLYSNEVGNRQLPKKFIALKKRRHYLHWAEAAVVFLVLAALAGAFIYLLRRGPLHSVTNVVEKSIAVLPFENRSRDPDNAYFAEGIQDEILTRLSKIADLKVISRTSTQHYNSAPENLPEIARQLGVSNILEGSVQKSADSVRVNVQLIKAANDSHIWADTFDRRLTDIFSVESDIAKAVADQLQASLTGQEQRLISAKPTENPEAYDAYLRGLAFNAKVATPPNAVGAQKYFRQAVRLDPQFALAWALLSYSDSLGYLTAVLEPTDGLREEARQAAQTALRLRPDLGEAVLAQGYYYYGCLKDYDTALHYFEQARSLLPNSSRIPESLAYVARRRGQWEQSELYFNEAERLDPRNPALFSQHVTNYIALRRLPEALRKNNQVLNIIPDDVDSIAVNAAIAQMEGDLSRAAALLAPLHPGPDLSQALETQVYQSILERRPAAMILRLNEVLANPEPELGFYNGELRFWLGWAQQVNAEQAEAHRSWQQARSELEPLLKEQSENLGLITDLALTAMFLGDKVSASALAERAMRLFPIAKDALTGPRALDVMARVAAGTGESERSIATLEKLMSMPYEGPFADAGPLTPALLRLDPMFDPLRNDPRFQKLCEEKQK